MRVLVDFWWIGLIERHWILPGVNLWTGVGLGIYKLRFLSMDNLFLRVPPEVFHCKCVFLREW